MRSDEITIEASVERVWALTVAVERWPELTPTMTAVERLDDGPMKLGSRARVKQPGMPSAVWTVTELDPGSVFAWQTKVGTVTMVGRHELEPSAEGCRNTVTVELSGFASTMLERVIGSRIGRAIETENVGFKRGAERPPHELATP